VLFGGDWPVATLATDYRRWIETVRDLISPVQASGRAKLFQANAERVYRV
jgi:L-fuconolactonase